MNESFERLLQRAEQLISRIESVLPQPLGAPDWSASIAFRYRKRSSGHGVLEPVRHVAQMRLADLQEIDGQKDKIQRNTLQFVQGQPANNVLLTGARGTGKSSLVKACLNEYAAQGLRLIEVDTADLVDLPDIVDVVADRPERFIVFCDDLSFEDGEAGYNVLDGHEVFHALITELNVQRIDGMRLLSVIPESSSSALRSSTGGSLPTISRSRTA